MRARIALSRHERVILDVVRRRSGIARSALTDHTDVTQQSVHRMVDRLEDQGLVQLKQGVASGRGKPSPGVTLVPEAALGVGLSVNTDAILISLADLACREVVTERVDTDPTDRQRALADISDRLNGLLGERGLPKTRLLGVGFSISGFRTGVPGHVMAPVPLEDWSNRDLGPEVAEALGLPVWLENNATAGAIGEAMVGAGLTHDTFAYLSFNFGFGGGVIHRGVPLRGGFGNAGELGFIFTADQIPHRPALEQLQLRLRDRGVETRSITDLAQRYDPAWPGIDGWVAEVAPTLNLTIRALRAVADPTAIVFGGEAPRDLRAKLIAATESEPSDRPGRTIPVPVLINSALAVDPAALGAALIPIKETALL